MPHLPQSPARYGQLRQKDTMKALLTFLMTTIITTVFGQAEQKKNPIDFLPKGFVVFEMINGDFNKDGIEDCVLIIKGTDKNQFITDEYRGQLDRNRRGIIILFNKKDHYELLAKNYTCFSSENEDGGVYYAPELSIEIKKGNLIINYAHGRYGYWGYTFRFQNSSFELIGYDESDNQGPVVNNATSINFSTKKKLVKVNTNQNADSGEEVFKTTTKRISIDRLLKLSEIKDFDELDMNKY
jgi:hypothetical protein